MKSTKKQFPILTGLLVFSLTLTGLLMNSSPVYAVGETQYSPANAYLVVTPSTATWTNKAITLTIKGSLNNTDITYIRLPNGSIVNGSQATFIVSENGYYPFMAQDKNGQYLTGGFTVSTIEKGLPIISMPNLPLSWVNADITVKVDAE